MSDLVAFLRARLDEDEAAAKKDQDAPEGALRYSDIDEWGSPLAWLMTSDRALREVEAKRVILAAHEHRTEYPDDPQRGFGCDTCHFDRELGFPPGIDWCQTLRALADVYSDHPDYDGAWRP